MGLVKTQINTAETFATQEKNSNDQLRVLIIESELLLGAGLSCWLSQHTDFELIGLNPTSEIELIRDIKKLQPCVIILDEMTPLITPLMLLNQLKESRYLQIILINTDSNLIRVYSTQQFLIATTNDLAHFIQPK